MAGDRSVRLEETQAGKNRQARNADRAFVREICDFRVGERKAVDGTVFEGSAADGRRRAFTCSHCAATTLAGP